MMAQYASGRRYLLWIFVTVAMAVVTVFMLAFQLVQVQASRQDKDTQVDSLTALLFQFEREFLRFRYELKLADFGGEFHDQDALRLRLDILLSRRSLLKEVPRFVSLRLSKGYANALPIFDRLIGAADTALARKPVDTEMLREVLTGLDALGPDIQGLSLAANTAIALQIESQQGALLAQHLRIFWLSLGQLVMLVVAAVALVVRHRRLEADRLAQEGLNSRLLEANQKAEKASRSMSQFLANMSHELRTPLNGMQGMLSLLRDSALDQRQQRYVRTAVNSAEHLMMLLNDVLDLSSIEAGKMVIHPEHLQLHELVLSVGNLLRPQAEQKGLDFKISIADDVPNWIIADGTRMKQILLNLQSNAIKFSDQGCVRVDVQAIERADIANASETLLRFTVTDQGIGMNAQTLARLFHRFEQGDGSSSRLYGGSGLGLEISQSLARLMKGEIGVTSRLGIGSIFTFDVLLQSAQQPQFERIPVVELGRDPSEPGLDIVVAEDHPINRMYMKELLSRLGHVVRFAEDGESAISEARRRLPDLILMDLHMPNVDGFQAAQELRAGDDAAALVPIVALTADTLADSRERAMAAGMDEFLTKPVRIEQIEQLLVKLFGTRGAAPSDLQWGASSDLTASGTSVPATPTTSNLDVRAKAVDSPVRSLHKRVQAGDVERQLDLAHIGDLLATVKITGYQNLLESFFLDESHAMHRLCGVLVHGPAGELEATAHSVKGAAASLGLKSIAGICFEIEHEGAALDAAGLDIIWHRLCESVRAAHALLQTMGFVKIACPVLGQEPPPKIASPH
jgi:signal transduction histidine kinase/CheY-like chemotaxis protein/HPt (histidine-containing phosphotransfer) domain-containing protein